MQNVNGIRHTFNEQVSRDNDPGDDVLGDTYVAALVALCQVWYR